MPLQPPLSCAEAANCSPFLGCVAVMLPKSVDTLTEYRHACRTKAATETISKAASASAGATRGTTQEVQTTSYLILSLHSLLRKRRSVTFSMLPQCWGSDTLGYMERQQDPASAQMNCHLSDVPPSLQVSSRVQESFSRVSKGVRHRTSHTAKPLKTSPALFLLREQGPG